jgi:hypothetical protein
MIETVSDILSKFIDEEKRRLESFKISHGPTIGAMYEGLTASVLNRAIPKSLKLNIVSGFITGGLGDMSHQIDCMLVRGNGEQIPYTDSYFWHVKDVIAVFEVKKSLFSNEFLDSYEKMRAVYEIYGRYVELAKPSGEINISSTQRAFSEITGIIPPEHKDVSKLPFDKEMIFRTLLVEQISPIRIVLGYDGFKTEYSFREKFRKFLSENVGKKGFGVSSYPQLCISGLHSLVKLNGQPYTSHLDNGWWNYLVSSSANPVLLMLEFIWTRLTLHYNLHGLWGEDLKEPIFHYFLKARAVQRGESAGWEGEYFKGTKKTINETQMMIKWEPTVVNVEQFQIFNNLCRGKEERIDDLDLIKYLEKKGFTIKDFTESLLATGLVAIEGNILRLTTNHCQCAILPDGRYVVAENNTGRFSRWMFRYIQESRDNAQKSEEKR